MSSMDDEIRKLNETPLGAFTKEQADVLARIMAERPDAGVKWGLEVAQDAFRQINEKIDEHQAEILKVAETSDWPDTLIVKSVEAVESLNITGISEAGEEGETANVQGALTFTRSVPCVLWFADPDDDAPHTLWVSQHVDELHKVLKLDFPGVTFTIENYPPAFRVVNDRNIARGYPDPRPSREIQAQEESHPYPFKARDAIWRMDPVSQFVPRLGVILASADWQLTSDGRSMAAAIPGSKLIEKVVYSPSEILEQGYENWEEEERRRVDAMLASIRNAKLTPSDAVVMLYVIDRLIRSDDPSIYVSTHELLDLERIGNRRTRAFNQEQADRYHRIFTLIHQTKFYYRGEPRWAGKGKKKRKQVDAYESPAFVYGGRKATMQNRLPGMGAADDWEIHRFMYHILPSQYIQSMQRDSSLSSWLGNLKAIAGIPSAKPKFNWAKAIGLVVVPHARNNASHIVKIKRRTLLETVAVDPSPESILKGPRPTNAQDYFYEAMVVLQKKEIIADWKDPTPAKNLPRGWSDGWLDQTIEVTMGEEYRKRLAEIAEKRPTSQKKLPKPPQK